MHCFCEKLLTYLLLLSPISYMYYNQFSNKDSLPPLVSWITLKLCCQIPSSVLKFKFLGFFSVFRFNSTSVCVRDGGGGVEVFDLDRLDWLYKITTSGNLIFVIPWPYRNKKLIVVKIVTSKPTRLINVSVTLQANPENQFELNPGYKYKSL